MQFLTRLRRSAQTKTLSLPLGERVKAGRRQPETEHVKAVCQLFPLALRQTKKYGWWARWLG